MYKSIVDNIDEVSCYFWSYDQTTEIDLIEFSFTTYLPII